jgi:pilus assembly protein CpaF
MSVVTKLKPDSEVAQRQPRKTCFWSGRLETERGDFDCRVVNMSPGGAKLKVSEFFQIDEAVKLIVPRFDPFSGAVRWQRNGCIGIQFEQPATDAEGEAATSSQARGADEFLKFDRDRLQDAVGTLLTDIIERIDTQAVAKLPRPEFERQMAEVVREVAREKNMPLNGVEQALAVRQIVDEMVGFGPLEPLLADPTVTDILVNNAKTVFVERRGKLELSNVQFADNAHVMHVATRIVTLVGRRIDESVPMVDARLPDGSRVNIIIPPLSLGGPMISIRKFSKKHITLEDMVRIGSLSTQMAMVLRIAVRSGLNILIAGGTGAGKTTLLNAMAQCIDPAERVITIEDAAELQIDLPDVGRLESRPPNLEGNGEFGIRDLFKNALRMRPDRIIVGEIRGLEAFDMLQAMNSGHDGSLGTIHASGPREALTRLENILGLIGATGVNMPVRAARTQIASALDMVVQVSRMRDGKRRVTSIMEVIGMEGEVITTQELFTYRFESENANGDLIGSYVSEGLRPHFAPDAEFCGLGRELTQALNRG